MATIVTPQPDALAADAAGRSSDVAVASGVPMFTCLSCSIGYPNPEDQRAHYRTDLHRYNMKRRVANLPPVRADVFNAKILERRVQEEKETTTLNQDRCRACNKSFSSANAFLSHLNSKKHKEAEARATVAGSKVSTVMQHSDEINDPLVVKLPQQASGTRSSLYDLRDVAESLPASTSDQATVEGKSVVRRAPMALQVSEDADEDEIQAAIDAKVASSRRIDPTTACIFCNVTGFEGLDASVQHMSRYHGFFVPEQEYLTDATGLMKYLADKVCVGNICLYCNGKGRGFATGEAVRKHMIDKSHCKVAYESEEDKLELSDFYDFTSSYPDAADGWEDVSDEDDDDDAMTESISNDSDDGDDDESSPSGGGGGGVRYGDTEFELILPSGVRLGHRSMRRYYNQSLRPTGSAYADATSGRQLAHRLNEKTTRDPLMVENRGGQMVRARNRGEAREAKKHISTYRDMAKREHFKTQVGYRANNQKHFRDPLLQ